MDYSIPFLEREVEVTMDQPIGSLHPLWGWEYPINYGFVNGTIAPDGEGIDAYVMGISVPVEKFTGKVIAIIHRIEDDDDKLIVAPDGQWFTDSEIRQATFIQEQWFKSVIIRKLV